MLNRLLLTSLLLGCAPFSHATDVTTYLQQQAEAFVKDLIDAPLDSNVVVTAATPDPRLALTRCDNLLTISLPSKTDIRRNTTVYLKCADTQPWDLYLPVRVSIQQPYVTVHTAVAKGELLDADQLTIAYQGQTLMRGDVVAQPEQLVGVRTKREIKPGQAVRLSQVCVVCKGDQVTLSAVNNHFQIKTMARALQDGNIGESIRLVNIRSGKTVTGNVDGVGQVSVTF